MQSSLKYTTENKAVRYRVACLTYMSSSKTRSIIKFNQANALFTWSLRAGAQIPLLQSVPSIFYCFLRIAR